MKQCHLCGIEIPETSARTKFCSSECSYEFTQKRHRKPLVSYPEKPCKNCGKMFLPKQCNSHICSAGCRVVRLLPAKNCVICGIEITPKSRKKYCSDRCADKKRLKKYDDRTCIYCGKMFSPKNSRVKTCQDQKCLKAHCLAQENARRCADAGHANTNLKVQVLTKCPKCEKLYKRIYDVGWIGRGVPRVFCNACNFGYVANNSSLENLAICAL